MTDFLAIDLGSLVNVVGGGGQKPAPKPAPKKPPEKPPLGPPWNCKKFPGTDDWWCTGGPR
jgi:hypothetical protein